MTTLSADSGRIKVIGNHNDIPVIASEIIYEGAAVGVVTASGHARPLQVLDKFVGFANEQCDNSSGAAAAKNVRVDKKGTVKLTVSGVTITDINQPVYAIDDDTFTMIPTGGVFIGFVRRWDSSGVADVEFNADVYTDPYLVYGAPEFYETSSGTKTFDIQDNGKVYFVTDDAHVITLPAVATGLSITVVNMGSFGTVLVTISPAADDMIHAPDLAGTDDKDHLNTKATAQRGDLCKLVGGLVASGYNVVDQKGIWAQEAA